MAFLIALEGLDFSGKSTTLKNIKNKLSKIDKHIVYTREPGGTPLGEKIRTILTTKSQKLTGLEKLNLFQEAREEHITQIIEPSLFNHQTVITDRYVGSTYAYQVGGDKLDFNFVDDTIQNMFKQHPVAIPDLTIYFQIAPNVRLARKNQNQTDALDTYNADFYKRVEDAYLKGINQSSKNFVIIDANDTSDLNNKLFNVIKDVYEGKYE